MKIIEFLRLGEINEFVVPAMSGVEDRTYI
jgi:hypothetical protein